MRRLIICLVVTSLLVMTQAAASGFTLRLGLYDFFSFEPRDITEICEDAFGFRPTNVIPLNFTSDSLIDGYIGFDFESQSISYYDNAAASSIPIEDFITELFGFTPLRLSVVHRSGEYDDLVGWDFNKIVILSLDDFHLDDVTLELAGALSVSGLCGNEQSNIDEATIVYDGEDWYLDYEYITDLVENLLGVDVFRMTPLNFQDGAADDGLLFTYGADNEPPQADFSIDPETGDTKTTFWFDASSSSDYEDASAELKVRWDFDSDGVYETERSYDKQSLHAFTTPGRHDITVEVMDMEGATDTATKTLTVQNSLPTARFESLPDIGTIGTLFWFDASTSHDVEDAAEELEVRWDFESDGEYDTDFSTDKTVSHQYERPMQYTVTLLIRDTSAGVAATTGSVEVQNMGPYPCFEVAPPTGNYETEFEFDASCSSDVEDDITALQVRWDWDSDGEYDTDFSYNKVAERGGWPVGTHLITIEVRDSAGDSSMTAAQIIVENTAPNAAFLVQPIQGTVRTAFNFDAGTSSDLEDETADLLVRWDFNSDGEFDTSFSTTKTAARSFASPGQKTITVQVADTHDARSVESHSVTVANTSPVACFTFTPHLGDTNTDFSFDASCSTDWESTTGSLEFRWDFNNDGAYETEFSSSPDILHRFSEPGSWTVVVEVKDAHGATDQVTQAIDVEQGNRPPVACFTVVPQNGTTETVFEFDASCSSDPDSDTSAQLQIRWDFEGDGVFDTSFSTTKSAYHTYTTTGYKDAVLEVLDTEGGTDTATQRLFIEAANVPPVACFGITPESGNTTTNFSLDASCSNDPDGSEATLQFRWDFENDGVFDTAYLSTPFISHQFTTAGSKTVLLEVKDIRGSVNTTTRNLTVDEQNVPPVACFTVTPLYGNTTTDFAVNATCSNDPDGSEATLRFRWDWTNDGVFDTSYSNQKTASHRYTTPGTKTIVLQAMDSEGATDQTTWTVEVEQGNEAPIGCFTVNPSAGTTDTNFAFDSACSSDPDGSDSTLQVRWDWTNDGVYDTAFTTTKTANHSYPSPGEFVVLLEVKDAAGATGHYAKGINVQSSDNNPPVAYFTVEPSAGTLSTLFFFDASSSFDTDEATGGTLQFRWDFDGDGTYDTSYSYQQTTTHTFGETGTYNVQLEVRDPQGAADTCTRPVYVTDV
ncbi:PKD domain-containing protein [bacterium]|nr:PKD domain-containing protein [bacterium]